MTVDNGLHDVVSWHNHTTRSIGDGYGSVESHVKRVAVELGMGVWPVSEHGNVTSWAEGERLCTEHGIKFIPGIEAYFAPPNSLRKFHLGLYAMDEQGVRNLNKIVTQSYLDYYKYPTVTWENLRQHAKGIICLSGCADSFISCSLLGGKTLGPQREAYSKDDALRTRRKIQRFLDLFEDRFYLEVQRFPLLGRTRALNPAFAQFGRELSIPLLATADVHYPYPYQNEMQKVVHGAKRKATIAVAEAEWEYGLILSYPESRKEFHQALVGTGLKNYEARKAIDNTKIAADRCTAVLPKAAPIHFSVPNMKSILCGKPTKGDLEEVKKFESVLYFKKMIKDGLKYRMAQRNDIAPRIKDYEARINKEFKVIVDKGFADYFLVFSDLIIRTKERQTAIGPARGSAAASLIAYVLRLTEIDPLYPPFDRMIFERFIDPSRSDAPDIDLDFPDDKRIETVHDARKIYGHNNVAAVANHNKYRGKDALNGVARAYGLPQAIFKPIGDRVTNRTETDDRVDDSITDVLESYDAHPDIGPLLDEYRDKLNQAALLEGMQQNVGVHASGYAVCTEEIDRVSAVYTIKQGTGRNVKYTQVIPWDKRDAEYLGILKMDFLGLTTMGMLDKIVEWGVMSLEELYSLFYTKTPALEREIMRVFQTDDVTGIFQFEGGTTRQLCKKLKPETFDHLAAINALSRPGPYYGRGADGMTQAEAYCAVKNGEMDWERIHPNYDQHVEWTCGQIVYQEQIMFILRDLAGFDVPTVLRVRKIIGKKLGEHQFVALWEQFKSGCMDASNLSEERAQFIWNSITTAAGYAFNIAHAYSYSLIAWWQAYVKTYHVTEFFASSLYKNGDGKDDLPRRTALLQNAEQRAVKVDGFDPNVCEANWYYAGFFGTSYDAGPTNSKFYMGRIIPGFAQIPGVGINTANDIVEWRKECVEVGKAIEWDDLLRVQRIGAKTVEKFKKFAAQVDPLGITRTQNQLSAFREQLVGGEFDETGMPCEEEFVSSKTITDDTNYSAAFVGFVSNIVFRDEVETIRNRTGRPIDEIKAEMDHSDRTKKSTLFSYDEFGEVALRVSRFQYPKLQGRISKIRKDHHIVVAYGKVYDGNALQVKTLWILDPDEG